MDRTERTNGWTDRRGSWNSYLDNSWSLALISDIHGSLLLNLDFIYGCLLSKIGTKTTAGMKPMSDQSKSIVHWQKAIFCQTRRVKPTFLRLTSGPNRKLPEKVFGFKNLTLFRKHSLRSWKRFHPIFYRVFQERNAKLTRREEVYFTKLRS